MSDPKFRSYRPLIQHSTDERRMKLLELAKPYDMRTSDVALDRLIDLRYQLATSDRARHESILQKAQLYPVLATMARERYDEYIKMQKQLELERQAYEEKLKQAVLKYTQLQEEFKNAKQEWEHTTDLRDRVDEGVVRQIQDAASLRDMEIGDGSLSSKVAAFIKGSMRAALVPNHGDGNMVQYYENRLGNLHKSLQESCSMNGIECHDNGVLDIDLGLYLTQVALKCKALADANELQQGLQQRLMKYIDAAYEVYTAKPFESDLTFEQRVIVFFTALDSLVDVHIEHAKERIMDKVLSVIEASCRDLQWQLTQSNTMDRVRHFASNTVKKIQLAHSNDQALRQQIMLRVQQLGLSIPSSSNMTSLQLLNSLTAEYSNNMQSIRNAYHDAKHELDQLKNQGGMEEDEDAFENLFATEEAIGQDARSSGRPDLTLKSSPRRLMGAEEESRQEELTGVANVSCANIIGLLHKIEDTVVEHRELFASGRVLPDLVIQTDPNAATANLANMKTWLTTSFALLKRVVKHQDDKFNALLQCARAWHEREGVARTRYRILLDYDIEMERKLQRFQTLVNELLQQRS